MNLAVLLTCHNRRAKTAVCLQSLKQALEAYNSNHEEKINMEVFLTDDGCTDGTSEAAREVFPSTDMLHILQGDGNLFWAGGMRYCWKEALKRHNEWDYYLLVNDDVVFMDNLFYDFLYSDSVCVEEQGIQGILSGFTVSPKMDKTSFGGSTDEGLLNPSGVPQLCKFVCANALLVPKSVVDTIGIFDEDYIHGGADYDYGLKAKKAGIPVLTNSSYIGICENEHYYDVSTILDLSLKDRKRKLYLPPRGKKDYLTFLKKHNRKKYLPSLMVLGLQIYFPHLYIILFSKKVSHLNKKHNR
jgi:GT2 family glycosyltransferase